MRNLTLSGLILALPLSQAAAAGRRTAPPAPAPAGSVARPVVVTGPAEKGAVAQPLGASAQLQTGAAAVADAGKHEAKGDGASEGAVLTTVFDAAMAKKGEPVVAVPDQMTADGIPAVPQSLQSSVASYMEMRSAGFASWHPAKREMLIVTRFGDTAQLHSVAHPGGDRRQMTFFKEPVAGGGWHPVHGRYILYSRDTGGGEFYQLYRFDPATGVSTMLTDGKSRNTGANWSNSGEWLAYTSTRRNGRDADVYVVDPESPETTTRLVTQVDSGGWEVTGWSPDGKTLALGKYISINETQIHLVDVATGQRRQLTPNVRESYGDARFARDGKSLFAVSTRGSEFHRLVRLDAATGKETPFGPDFGWGVESFSLTKDGKLMAVVTNEDGASVLRVLDADTGKVVLQPKLPFGVIGSLRWHANGRDLGFSMSSAKSSGDVYSLDVRRNKITRWTSSETGGLDAARFQEPELVRLKSFDGLTVSGFLYKPDPAKFPGKRPVVVAFHGGPEGQSRPSFQGRLNYLINELGIAVLFPNVRGSSGYGKTFLDLDNGFKREDSVKDGGAFIDWIKTRPDLDGGRIAVMGGSYGGYMTLASLVHYSAKLVGGIDSVGISNFVTFLENTQEYRRDLRRVEYGDERDPAMREFLLRISPTSNVDKITKPLFVVQGANDPRVPVGEAEQMVKAVRAAGKEAWYMLAKDEGHGFAKKKNADYYFLAMVMFLSAVLLGRRLKETA